MAANVTASLTTKGDKYYVIVCFYTDDGRKQKWINTGLTVSGNHKREAQKRCQQLIFEYQEKLALNNGQVHFSEYLKQWLETWRTKISDSTYHEYRKAIHNIICPYFEKLKIKLFDLKAHHIQEFYEYKMNTDGVSANTIYHYHANIHKALDFAVKMDRIASNPADKVELPKKEDHHADFYTVDELKTLLEESKGKQIEPVIKLAAWYGLRRGEIIGLRWSCINFDSKTLSITGTVKDKGLSGSKIKNMYYSPTAKTKSSLRSMPMSDEQVTYLMDLKAQQDARRSKPLYNHAWDDFVCVRENGDLIPLEYVTRAFPKLCSACGLRPIKLHELRHTNISLMLATGHSMKEAQEWAGHSNFSITANTYAHTQASSKTNMLESINTLLTG